MLEFRDSANPRNRETVSLRRLSTRVSSLWEGAPLSQTPGNCFGIVYKASANSPFFKFHSPSAKTLCQEWLIIKYFLGRNKKQ